MPAIGNQPNSEDSVWARRLETGPHFSVGLGWGPGQVLESFWRDIFSTTRPGANVLELGCGSGDVSGWAAATGRGFSVMASDPYTNAAVSRRHPDVMFLAARAEALPVPSESIDLVVSNFAIEYSPDRPGALSELARVLRPGGGAVLVLHSVDSTLTEMSRITIDTEKRIAEADIPDRVRRAAALRPDHLSRRKLLKDVLKRWPEFPDPPLGFTGVDYFRIAERLLQGDKAARQDLAELDQAIAMRLHISRDQSQVALDAAALADLQRQIGLKGLTAHTSEMTCTYDTSVTEKVGWISLVTKA
jgi:SAM-dependent methyltransferase